MSQTKPKPRAGKPWSMYLPTEEEIREECRKIREEHEAQAEPEETRTVDYSRPHRVHRRRR